METVAVLTEDGAFAFLFRPHPREFVIQGKKNANARGSARSGGGGGWAQLELTDALLSLSYNRNHWMRVSLFSKNLSWVWSYLYSRASDIYIETLA